MESLEYDELIMHFSTTKHRNSLPDPRGSLSSSISEPPSAPLNLTVLQVTNTSVQLSWDPPVSNGGRDDLEYRLSYQRAGVPDNVTVCGRINVTMGQITGLRPFVEYVVMVSGENGVSAQATDTSGRTVSATTTTEEGGEFIDFYCRNCDADYGYIGL